MYIYSDTLTTGDIWGASRLVDELTPLKAPRKRSSGWKFRLSGGSNRLRNSGVYGPENVLSATWDQHGRFFARLFDMDPDAIIGQYRGRDDFHAQTSNKYRTSLLIVKTPLEGGGYMLEDGINQPTFHGISEVHA